MDEAFLLDIFNGVFGNQSIAIEQIPRNNLDTKIKNNIFYLEIDLDKFQPNEAHVIEEQDIKFKKYIMWFYFFIQKIY